ncbi:hypothetical protein K2173_003105 [Erythroxylum novogranatense]|uniref:Uncharacterized protein n=1 Tax=Erythroxylum novogranatense TaxID=1862640 RepID=A0AAV8TAC3_9ROSI|nr:hypothetical protein K2173_003105 [Erythroxylum novogranatense]
MKLTGDQNSASAFPPSSFTSKLLIPPTHSDLITSLKPHRWTRNPRFTRLKRVGAPAGRRSRPETPLSKWKIEDRVANVDDEKSLKVEEEKKKCVGRGRRRSVTAVSARKLSAGLWRLQLPETEVDGVGERRRRKDAVGFQRAARHVAISFAPRDSEKMYTFQTKDTSHILSSVSGMRTRFLYKIEPSFQFSNSAMEGATKWDPVCLASSDETRQIYSNIKCLNQQVSTASVVSALEAELEQTQARILDLETERRLSKQKLEHFLKKVNEERAAWRSREHEKIRAFVDDVKTDMNRERKNRRRLEKINSKLVNELAEAKVSAKRNMQDYEKERKARELIEEVCDELAKEIGEGKAEVDVLKRDSMKFREEVDEERRMLQMAEVWREERVQMKLVDAKVTLEEKYSQMIKLVADLEAFLRSRNTNSDFKEIKEAELLMQTASLVNIQDTKAFVYEAPCLDDVFSVLEDVNRGETVVQEIEPCVAYTPASHASIIQTVSPEINFCNKDGHRHFSQDVDQTDEVEEDGSGWETVSHLEDQSSSYSAEGSSPSVNKNLQCSNISGSETEWEGVACDGTPFTEISELCSVSTGQLNKVSSIARLWRSFPNNGENYKIMSMDRINGRLSDGRKSNGSILSPDQGSVKGGLSPSEMMSQWGSPNAGNPYITQGLKGCIDSPRGAQKNSLKAKLLEARMDRQKVQLRRVLEEKI